jgi:hypothetical protein
MADPFASTMHTHRFTTFKKVAEAISASILGPYIFIKLPEDSFLKRVQLIVDFRGLAASWNSRANGQNGAGRVG